jgi:hypothetical protein
MRAMAPSRNRSGRRNGPSRFRRPYLALSRKALPPL